MRTALLLISFTGILSVCVREKGAWGFLTSILSILLCCINGSEKLLGKILLSTGSLTPYIVPLTNPYMPHCLTLIVLGSGIIYQHQGDTAL